MHSSIESGLIYPLFLGNDHCPPNCLPSAVLANEYKQVAPCIGELFAAHLIADLIRVSRDGRVVDYIDACLAQFKVIYLSLAAEVHVTRNASLSTFGAVNEIWVHHHYVFAKKRRELFGRSLYPCIIQLFDQFQNLLTRC